jgi:hypothetical protein
VDHVEKKAFSVVSNEESPWRRHTQPMLPPLQPDILSGWSEKIWPSLSGKIHLCCPAAVTAAVGRASIQIDMKLQKETKTEPRETARLNRLVFGVALLWLVTSLLLLLMYRTSPAHAVQPNRASQEQKLAVVAPQAAQAPFIC